MARRPRRARGGAVALAPLYTLSADTDSVFDVVCLIAFLGFALWIVLVGIAMVARRDEPQPEAGAAATTAV